MNRRACRRSIPRKRKRAFSETRNDRLTTALGSEISGVVTRGRAPRPHAARVHRVPLCNVSCPSDTRSLCARVPTDIYRAHFGRIISPLLAAIMSKSGMARDRRDGRRSSARILPRPLLVSQREARGRSRFSAPILRSEYNSSHFVYLSRGAYHFNAFDETASLARRRFLTL